MREYMERLRARGELLVVAREVDPKYELAAVVDKVQRTVNKAILFERVRGTAMPVLSNIYGSRERLGEVVGIAPEAFCREWSRLAALGAFPGPFTREVAMPAGLEHGRLGDLPLLTHAARDAAPYFTSAIFLAKEPGTGIANMSFHRAMYVSDEELRLYLAKGHHLTRYHEEAESRGEALECAMLIGPPKEMFAAAAAPVPYEVDEVEVASGIAGRTFDIRPCRHIDLMVPAETEIVIEGRILAGERRPEGPFGEFVGTYTPVADNPVFEVLGVSWRPEPVFHALLCGSPEEILSLQLKIAAKVFERVNAVLPGIVDVAAQPFPLHTVVKISQQYEGHARQVLLAAIAAETTWVKACTVVDEDVDIHDMDEVMWAILTRARPDRDVIVLDGMPSFYHDPDRNHWGRLAIDATAPFARRGEFERKSIPGAGEVDLSQYIANGA